MKKTEFFQKYGHRLVEVNNDDASTGDYMLYFPEEKYIAKKYQQRCVLYVRKIFQIKI